MKELPEQSPEEILAEFEEYLDMFATAGWQRFIQATEDQLKSDMDNAHLTHTTNDEWQQLRGHIRLVKRMLGFETMVHAQIDQIKEALENEKLAEQDDGEEITL